MSAIWKPACEVQAQISYLTDNRSVTASVGFNTNAVPPGATSYSGDYSASAVPSAPFADFGTNLGGSATVSYTNRSLSATVGAWQNSFLTSGGISYTSSVSESANSQPSSWNESSYLQIVFTVPSPTPYNLTCQRGPDPLFSTETWTLSGLLEGVMVSSPSAGSGNNGPFEYSGELIPGDHYTLTLQEVGGMVSPPGGDIGSMEVVFSVPEPRSCWLLCVGLCGLFFCLKGSRGRDSA